MKSSTKSLILKANNNSLSVEFQANPKQQTSYFYQLKGFDTSWFTTDYPIIKYMNLSANDYELLVIAKVKQQVIYQDKIAVKVQNAFWNETWFYITLILYIILIIGIGFYLFFLYDFRQKLKVQHIRNRIASDLHDEVGSNLNSIAIFVELLRKKIGQHNPEILPILEKITNNSAESVGLMRDTVWAINPNNDTLEKLFGRMQNFSTEVLSARDIAYNFDNQTISSKVNLSMEQRRNVYLVFKEAINNIVKHAEATKVLVLIKAEKNVIVIHIKDNGIGFDTEQVYEGNGLESFKIRSEEGDLVVNLNSVKGKGTEVILMAYEV
jgi:signal transduction histidine kinase